MKRLDVGEIALNNAFLNSELGVKIKVYNEDTATRSGMKIAKGWTSLKQLKLQDRQRQEHQENQGKQTKTKEKQQKPKIARDPGPTQ